MKSLRVIGIIFQLCILVAIVGLANMPQERGPGTPISSGISGARRAIDSSVQDQLLAGVFAGLYAGQFCFPHYLEIGYIERLRKQAQSAATAEMMLAGGPFVACSESECAQKLSDFKPDKNIGVQITLRPDRDFPNDPELTTFSVHVWSKKHPQLSLDYTLDGDEGFVESTAVKQARARPAPRGCETIMAAVMPRQILAKSACAAG